MNGLLFPEITPFITKILICALPKEAVDSLEVGSAGVDFVDQVLKAVHAFFFKVVGDDEVGGKGDSLLVDFSTSSLVDQIVDGFSGWVSVGDVWLHESEHSDGGLGGLDEDSIVKLSQSQ